ncbi:hypothetical protein C8J56DRAFT_965263 [Mycena floridula]|nr:hypothetical protein C8J56DRAFT_965263 [Mycena floridula]
MAKRLLITFWPRFDCTGCVKFKNSHAVAEGAAKAPVEVPLDAEERDDVQKNRKDDNQASDNDFQGKEDDDSGEEGSDEEKLDRIEVEADVRQEIATLLDLIKSYDEEHGVTPELKKAMKGTEGPSFEHEHHRFMPQLMAAAEKLGVPEEIMPTMRKWFTFAVYVLVQVWSQMVRHNTTVARLTSHNLGIVVLRDREEQRMTISKIFTHEHQLLQMTGLTVYALDDGKKRHARHIEKGVPFWKVDWFRGGGPDIEVEEEDSDGDEGRKRGQKRRKVVPASDDSDGDDHGGDDSDQDDGAGGSNGPAPGPGSDQKKLGRKDDGRSHRNDRSNQSGKSVGGQSWAGVTGLALLHLDVQNVHLGFRLSNGMLWSTGFSCLKRIDLSSAVETIASEKKMAPARHEYPSSETDTSSITTPAASPQRVTASSGALGRTGSDSSVGTASSVGTLFGSQASAAPSSPATTLSFSTGSESGDSPTRQGRGKLSIGSLETSVDSVLDETLSPEDLDTTQTTPVNERVPRLQSRFIHDVGILLDAAVSTGSTGIVWSGKMVLEGTEQVEEQLAIVVKLATAKEGPDVEGGMESDEAEELRKEGAVYEFLASQGDRADITPRYCGTFKDNRGSVALVLEHRGKALKSFDNLTKDQAELLLQKAKDLHSLRVNHGALFPCNIVQDDQGDLRIIDFHGAYVHSCPGERCRELVDFAKALGLKTEIA